MSDDRVFAKIAWRLIPFMALLYVINLVDRLNVGFAALTMNTDLGFSPSVFGFGAGAFFVGYLLFLVPSGVELSAFWRSGEFCRRLARSCRTLSAFTSCGFSWASPRPALPPG